MKKFFSYVVCGICFLAAHGAEADTVYLKSGKVIQGRILKETPIFIRMETDQAVTRQEFLQSDIKAVEYGVFSPSSKAAPPPPALRPEEESPRPSPEVLRLYGESPSPEDRGNSAAEGSSQEDVPSAQEESPNVDPSVDAGGAPRGIVSLDNNSISSGEDLLTEEIPPVPQIKGKIGWVIFGVVFLLILYLGFGQRKKRPLPQGEGAQGPKDILPMTRIIGLSVQRTKLVLFQPFQLKKWLLLLFIACMSGSLFSGGPNYSWNAGDRMSKAHAAGTEIVAQEGQTVQGPSQGVQQFFQKINKGIGEKIFPPSQKDNGISLIVGVLVLLFFGLILLFTWLGARFRLIWYDAIVKNDASVREPFRRLKKQGNSLFKFYLFMGVVFMVIIAAFFFWIFFSVGNIGAGWDHASRWPFKTWVDLFAPVLLSGLVLVLFLAIVSVFIHEFVLPIMVLEETTFIPAWRKFLEVYRAHTGRFWIYLIVAFGLSILVSLIAIVLAMAVALTLLVVGGIAFGLLYFLFVFLLKTNILFTVLLFILGIPALIVSILMFLSVGLPFAVFFRSFSLYFLGNLPCGYAPLPLKEEGSQATGEGKEIS